MAFEEILELYKEFTREATLTANMSANSLSDFIGWLQRKMEND